MDPWQVLKLLLLLVSANGAPLAASWLLGKRWNWPLDNHVLFIDQRPLLGPSKTLRGIVAAIVITSIVAILLGITWMEGALFGLLTMLGDLLASFIKRRLGYASSHSFPLLDQLPESLLPAWVMQATLGLSTVEMFAALGVFFIVDLAYSLVSDSGRSG